MKAEYFENKGCLYFHRWLGYFKIAYMKSTMEEWDGWLCRRLRMYI